MKAKTVDGVEVEIVQELQVNGASYFVIDPLTSQYVKGVLTRFMLCPKNQFDFDKSGLQFVETVKES